MYFFIEILCIIADNYINNKPKLNLNIMKINYFKKNVLTVIAVLFFTSVFALPEHVYLIGGPVNKNNPNWLTSQKVELTKDAVDTTLFYYKGYLAYNWRGDERGNIKFLIADNWAGAYHPDNDANQLLSGTTPMRQDGNDTKWFIPADRSGDGYYELTLNTQAMTLTVDSFRHDLNPEKIYAVGASMPCGWDNNNPEVLTRTNPEVAVYTWTGILNSGDFKFLTPLSIGNWDYCYDATSDSEAVTYGVSQDLVFEVRNSSETTFNDYKFITNEIVACTIIVDLVNMKMTVTPIKVTNLVDPKSDINAFAANGGIRVTCDNESIKTVDVFAVDGRKVDEKSFSHDVEISLTKGIYIVKVCNATTELITRKVIVTK
jgi:hypothetical protein